MEIEKLKKGFPEPLLHEVFCDEDLLIKAGLTRGVSKFHHTSLRELLALKQSSGSCIMPHKVSFKAVTSGKDVLAKVPKRKKTTAPRESSEVPSPTHVSKKSRKASKKIVTDDASVQVSPEAFPPSLPPLVVPSTTPLPITTLDIQDRPLLVYGMDSGHHTPPPPSSSPRISASSSGAFLGLPYTLPSGITVTDGTISKRHESTASLLLKNYLLKRDMEGIMGHPTSSSIHDAFSHFHLKSMECDQGLFLKWSECEDPEPPPKQRRALAAEFEHKHVDLHYVFNWLVKSKSDLSSKYEIDLAAFKNSLEEAGMRIQELQSQNDGTRILLAGSLEKLKRRSPPEEVIANFKEGQNYRDILLDDTVSIMKTYSLKIVEEFEGVSSIFPVFVEENFGKEYVLPLVDPEESDHEHDSDQSNDGFGEY
ncbi:hypothetical protein LIER_02542 [Lithospermum erythrorhizon]|uniref:Uncharacterized protein n=1 Tax=Lithospermum erythrorhizon TaxID=34254 RepID=A0AAV3NPW0_LITER